MCNQHFLILSNYSSILPPCVRKLPIVPNTSWFLNIQCVTHLTLSALWSVNSSLITLEAHSSGHIIQDRLCLLSWIGVGDSEYSSSPNVLGPRSRSKRLNIQIEGKNKKAQLSLTNPRDAKACQKLLQFDVFTTLSLTILAYCIFIRLAVVASEICETPRNSVKIQTYREFKVIKGHRS